MEPSKVDPSKTDISKIVFIDIDDTMAQHREAIMSQLRLHQWPQSQTGFYVNLEPIDGAIDAVKWLIDHPEYDVWFLTAPSVMNAHSYAEKRLWIEKWFGIELCHKLIIAPHKGLLMGAYLIDDNVKGKGQDKFVGKMIHYGSPVFPNWKAVTDYLDAELLRKD